MNRREAALVLQLRCVVFRLPASPIRLLDLGEHIIGGKDSVLTEDNIARDR